MGYDALRLGWACLLALSWAGAARADKPAGLSAQTLVAPSGPSSLKGLGDSFSANASTGTGSFSIPIEVPPGFMEPQLAVSYTNGSGKGVLGQSFSLPVLQVYRSRDKGAPRFAEDDRFAVMGPGYNDELVRVNEALGYYRLKNEGGFALFVRDAATDSWEIRFNTGERSYLGSGVDARQTSRGRSYRWFVERQVDQVGHEVRYAYLHDQGQVYLSEIRYQLERAAAYQNSIQFDYEPRPDRYVDYSYGAAVLSVLRMHRIRVLHGGTQVRSYAFAYQQGLLASLLSSVTMQGQSSSALSRLPTLSFSYMEAPSDAGHLVEMAQPPALEGLLDGRAQLEDVNADGLPDIYYGESGRYRYYENLDGRNWAQSASMVGGSPDRSFDEPGVVLTDVDGDGFRDLTHPHAGQIRYYPGGAIVSGVFRGYGPPQVLASLSPGAFDFATPAVKQTDLDADGRIDLLYQKPGQDTRVMNTSLGQLVEELVPEFPADVDFYDSRTQLADFNGDGELDFVRAELGSQTSRVRVWHGLGRGEYAPEQTLQAPRGIASEFHLEDVNHDGQTDLLRISGSWLTYYLNLGDGTFSSARGDFNGLPSTSATQRVLFGDMNGNGTRDVVWITTDGRFVYLDLFGQPNVGLLARIDNGMGLVTDMDYRSSVEYAIEAKLRGQPWRHPMPNPVPVLSEVRTSDSLDRIGLTPNETRISYDYRDGYYDGKEREFRGFAYAGVTFWGDADHETLVEETHMHVGRNPVTGADEEILKGKTYLTVGRNDQGQVYKTTEAIWERRYLCQADLNINQQILPDCTRFGSNLDAAKDDLVAFAQQAYAITGAWEKTTSPIYTLSVPEYDAWGKVTRQANYGQVRFLDARQPGGPVDMSQVDLAFGDDEAVNETDFINDIDAWRLNLPISDRVYDLGGRLHGETRYFYDGDGVWGASLPYGQATQGLLTRTEKRFIEEARFVPTERVSFNSDGLPVATMDAIGSLTELRYDSGSGKLPTLERMWVESGPLDTTASYDTAYGSVLQVVDINGFSHRFTYDGLGRLTTITDAHGYELARHRYQYGDPISVTSSDTLQDEATGEYTTRIQYTDGSSRTRLVKEQAEAGLGGWVGSGWTATSVRGSEVAVFDSFPSTTGGFEAPPAGTPATRTTYDGLSRPLRLYAAATPELGATYTLREYLPLVVRVYDERETALQSYLHPMQTRSDGLGRLREIEKTNDDAGTYRSLRWRIAYNARGDIVSVTDPAWTPGDAQSDRRHRRRYDYDSLGRMTGLTDPNLGTLTYAYDDRDNVTERIDALGQVQELSYGLMGRLLERRMRNAASGAPDYAYRFFYDAADPAGPLSQATNLLGRLAWVEYPVGTEHYSYDVRGNQEREARTLWNPEALGSTFTSQVRTTHQKRIETTAGGRIRSIAAASGLEIDFSYNLRSRLVGARAGFGAARTTLLAGAQFDARGSPVRNDLGNSVSTCKRYDERAQLVGALTGPSSVDCADTGRVMGVGFQNLRYARTYNGLIGGIEDYSAESPGVGRLDAVYDYDNLNQLVSATDRSGNASYRYDIIQNLVSQVHSGVPANVVNGDLAYGENGAGPSMVTSAPGRTYAYDALGQMTGYNGFDLHYNAEGQLVRAVLPGVSDIEYHYDAWGDRRLVINRPVGGSMRVTRTVSDDFQIRDGEEVQFVELGAATAELTRSQGMRVDLYLLNELIAYAQSGGQGLKPLPEEYLDLDGDGDGFDAQDLAVATTAYMNETRVGGSRDVWRYYHRDQLDGTTHITDSAGDWVGHLRYHPYGQLAVQRGASPARGFLGKELEEDQQLGLLWLGKRYYAPDLGRWITPDRYIGESPERMVKSPLESNLYSYAKNSPIGNADPTGKETVGEAIDRNGTAAAGREDMVETVMWASAHALWTVFGSEDVSKVADNAINGRTDMTTGDYAWAAFDVATLGKGKKVAKAGELVVKTGGQAARGAGRWLAAAYHATASLVRRAPCMCFVAGTLVTTTAGPTAIEEIRVGDRVTAVTEGDADDAATPSSDADAAADAEPEADPWRIVYLEAVNPDVVAGGRVEIELLRRQSWIAHAGLFAGGRTFVQAAEMELFELAYVAAIGDTTVARAPEGRLVTATFSYLSSQVLELTFAGADATVRLTVRHPLFSLTHNAWVEAQQLRVGDRVATRDGEAAVSSLVRLEGIHRVHNIEVAEDHQYFATDLELVSHNTCPIIEAAQAAIRSVDRGAASTALRAALRLGRGAGDAHHIIPWSLRGKKVVQKAAEAGWNVNGVENGIEMIAGHGPGGHPQYNKAVEAILDAMERVPDLTPEKAKAMLSSFVDSLRPVLEKNRNMGAPLL